MNEAKKQLLEKIGDTSAQSNRVQQCVMQKISKRQRKKVHWPYYITLATFAIAAILLFVIGRPFVNQKDAVMEPISNGTADEIVGTSYKQLLQAYFLPHGSMAEFIGEGNEYANYMQVTYRLSDEYVSVITINDGAKIEKLYAIRDDGIYLLDSTDAINEIDLTTSYTLDEIKTFTNKGELYLPWPVKVGAVVGDYKIIATDGVVETNTETFTNAIVLEKVQDELIFRDYIVEGYGEVRTEVIQKDQIVTYSMINIQQETMGVSGTTDTSSIPPSSTDTTGDEDSNQPMPEMVTLTSSLTGETKQFEVAKVEPIQLALQDANDITTEIEHMNFVELYLPVSNARYYLLRTECGVKNCNIFMLKEVNEEFTTVPIGNGLCDDYVEFSPNMKRALIRIANVETTLVVRHQLAVVNIETMERNYAQTKTEYFSEATWPIEKYNWKDDTTILIKTAEVFDSSYEALEGWRINSGTLMDVEIPFP